MKVIACHNIKGGVGKTTSAVNLAYLSAQAGNKTLLWDMDPQGSASMLLDAGSSRKSIQIFSKDNKKTRSFIESTPYPNLDILPADFSLVQLEQYLGDLSKPKKRVRQVLAPLLKKYKLVFIDCPAGYSEFVEILQQLSDVFLIPVIPSPMSLNSLKILKKKVKKNAQPNLIFLPFFSMVDRRKSLHKEIIGLHSNGSKGFLKNNIPISSKVEQMAIEQEPLHVYDTRSSAAKSYKALWKELNTNIEMYERVKKIKMW